MLHAAPQAMIQLPPLSSPQAGPPHVGFRPKAVAECYIQPAGGGYRPPITSEDGYRLGLTPECLRIRVDHRSVIHRLQQSLLVAKQVVRRFHRLLSLTSVGTASTLCPPQDAVELGPITHLQVQVYLRGRANKVQVTSFRREPVESHSTGTFGH
jgi:hypothetical protein